MVVGRGKMVSTPRRAEVVEHWCLEPACQSDPDAATNSQSVAPGPRGARRADCCSCGRPPVRGTLSGTYLLARLNPDPSAHSHRNDGGLGVLCPTIGTSHSSGVAGFSEQITLQSRDCLPKVKGKVKGVGSGINAATLSRKNDARPFLARAVATGGWSVAHVGHIDRSSQGCRCALRSDRPTHRRASLRASVSSDRSGNATREPAQARGTRDGRLTLMRGTFFNRVVPE